MESSLNGLRRNDQTLEIDSALRLSKHPRGNSNPNPKAFEDFGSSLAPRNRQAPPKSKPKPRSTVSQKPTRLGIKKPLLDFCESEDELDLLSSSHADSDNYQPSNKAPVFKPRKYADEKGKEHDYDPKFSDKSAVLSKLKFKKLGREDNTTVSSSSSLKKQPGFKENSQDFGSRVNDLKSKGVDNQATREYLGDDDVLEITSPLSLKNSNQRLSPPRSPSKQPVCPKRPDALPARPEPRPLPRPARKFNADAGLSRSNSVTIFVDGHELFPLGRTKTVAKTKYPSRSPSPEIYIPTPKKMDGTSKPPSFKASRKLRAFPMPSPQSSDKARLKGKNKVQPFLNEGQSKDQERISDPSDDERQAKKRRWSGVLYVFMLIFNVGLIWLGQT